MDDFSFRRRKRREVTPRRTENVMEQSMTQLNQLIQPVDQLSQPIDQLLQPVDQLMQPMRPAFDQPRTFSPHNIDFILRKR